MGAVSEPAWLLSHQVHHRNPRTYYVCVDIKYCSRADSESRNIRISADRLGLTPRSVHLQGRASPFLPEDRVPRHQPRLFPRTRFRGRTTPPSVATLNSVDLACRRWGKKKKDRRCFLETARFSTVLVRRYIHLFPRAAICFFFGLLSNELRYLFSSISRSPGHALHLPAASLGGRSPLTFSTPSASPPRDTSTAVARQRKQRAVFDQYITTTKTRLKKIQGTTLGVNIRSVYIVI